MSADCGSGLVNAGQAIVGGLDTGNGRLSPLAQDSRYSEFGLGEALDLSASVPFDR